MIKPKMATSILKVWTSPVKFSSRKQRGPRLFASSNSASRHSTGTKRWIHNDAMLVDGHVAYLVKFLGNVEVEQPKGLDIVRDAIKKLEFQQHLKRTEGEKIKRTELTISIDGVAIREPKTKQNIHQFPLHRISYCADENSERRYLTFITKVQEGSDRHECFVFISDKFSEEITLTIGQAFELAYRKFLLDLDTSKREFDAKKELIAARKRIQELEEKVTELERKLKDKSMRTEDGPGISEDPTAKQKRTSTSSHNPEFQTPPVSPIANQTIDLSVATSRLKSLIDLP